MSPCNMALAKDGAGVVDDAWLTCVVCCTTALAPAMVAPETATTHISVAVCAPVATVTVVEAVDPNKLVRIKQESVLAELADAAVNNSV